MPKIKIEKVVSFSSEDPVNVANNILSNDPSKKWKCHTPGEKSASLILQLEEASVISSIDIGNEHSAYIEVLVNRSGSNDDFAVLLVMSSFMSPLEARQSTNVNKVRMFTYKQLSQPEREEKWDRVKIVCTQPFNRHVTYGLSFITFHSIGKDASSSQVTNIGRFTLRPESPNNITIGSLFARKKELQDDKPITAAAAIRTASLSPHQSSKNTKKIKLPATPTITKDVAVPQLSRKRDEILYNKDEEEPNEKIDYIVEQKRKEKEQSENKNELTKHSKQTNNDKTDTNIQKEKKIEQNIANKDNNKKHEKNHDSPKPSSSKDRKESFKRKLNSPVNKPVKKVKNQLTKPFHELLSGVVFVISGIQNPDRTDIRAMALSMGAKYKGDWDNTCTHLICAFTNTPKFNQVKGKGKIVTKKWIIDCNTKRKRLPWRKYALDKNDQRKDESEEEICEEIETVNDQSDENREAKSSSDTEDEIERINTLQQRKDVDNTDTEDEIERITALNKTKDKDSKKSSDIATSLQTDNIYDCDTDEENDASTNYTEYPQLPNFYEDKVFFIDNNLNTEERKGLTKYITACNGTITTSLTDSIDYAISNKDHKLQLSNGYSHTVTVNADFVYECYNAKALIPVDDYLI